MARFTKTQSVFKKTITAILAAGAFAAVMTPAQAAWEPTKPVEFVVPAGTGGGADQMARLIQGIVIKHKLMKEPMIVVNKSGGAGAEGFLGMKDQGRSAQNYCYLVQLVHNAFGYWRTFQLERHDASNHDGFGSVCAVGEC
jgi:tripartite-type tricarboxylate transporter receptor subunit TctC